MSTRLRSVALFLLGTALFAAAADAATPIVFGHRGASAYRPEHTLESYRVAILAGADYIEPDLVSTKDGVLIARHENEIGGTTNVADHPEFASRRVTKVIDGSSITGWFTEDFTLAELKTLRAKERIPGTRPGNTMFDGAFEVPTLQEVIDLAKTMSTEVGRPIGIIPETKHPTYFDSVGLSLEEPLVAVLRANGYDSADDLAIIQSFEVGNLAQLNGLTDLRLVQLTSNSGRPYDFTASGDTRTYADLMSAAGLDFVNNYADILGPDKNSLFNRDSSGNLIAPNSRIKDAHNAGLQVVPYTFRPENQFLPPEYRIGTNANAYGNDLGEFLAYFDAGVDGLFADAPDRARFAADLWASRQPAAVPEPSTWAMMLAGFLAIGRAVRRQARKPALV